MNENHDKRGHFTNKQNDGGECKHEDLGPAEEFDNDYDSDFESEDISTDKNEVRKGSLSINFDNEKDAKDFLNVKDKKEAEDFLWDKLGYVSTDASAIIDEMFDEDAEYELSKDETDLCDYMLDNAYEEDMTAEDLIKKMREYYSSYSRLVREKEKDVLNYFEDKIESGNLKKTR